MTLSYCQLLQLVKELKVFREQLTGTSSDVIVSAKLAVVKECILIVEEVHSVQK